MMNLKMPTGPFLMYTTRLIFIRYQRQLLFEKTELETKYVETEEQLIISQELLREQLTVQKDELERMRQEKRELDEEVQMLNARQQPRAE